MAKIITMEDEILRVRNLVVAELAKAVGVKISLSDEQNPMAEAPYGYYTVLTPYVSTGELGSHIQRTVTDPDDGSRHIEDIRFEHPEIHISFSFCSANHEQDGKQIFGENEAMMLAMKAIGWLQQEGQALLSLENIVVLHIGSAKNRNALLGDEYVRRWGFDIALRYKALTVRRDEIIQQAHVGRIKMKE